MVTIDCPLCEKPMGIDDNVQNAEWECPTCEGAFRIEKNSDGTQQFHILTDPPAPTAVQSGQTQNRRGRRNRRRLHSETAEDTESPANLDISLPANSPLEHRFPEMQPVASPPSLFTFNGVGTMMYGSRDFDPATQTYVKSLCLVVVFIPMFIIGSYRVLDAPSTGWLGSPGWYFLGKVPLSPLAKGWNWLMFLFLFICLVSCLLPLR